MMISHIRPVMVGLSVLALTLGMLFWYKYFNFGPMTTRQRVLIVPVKKCVTSCCTEQKYIASAKHFASTSTNLRCYKDMYFEYFGSDVFSFETSLPESECNHILRLGSHDRSCQRSYYNISRRAIECNQTSQCTSELSKCLHHICAKGVIEYFEDLSGRKKHQRDGSEILSEIHRVPGSHELLASIMAKGRVNASVSTKEFLSSAFHLAYEQQKYGFPESLDYSMKSLLVGSWIACGMSSSAAIPFFEDMGPLVDSLRRWKVHNASVLSEEPFDRLVVATFATSHDAGLDVLIESAALVSLKLVVLGYGEVQAGKASKLPRMLEYLKTLHPDTVVLFVDGYDTMLVRGEDYILFAFHSLQKDIIFAAEGCCYPYLYHQYNLGVDLCDLYYPKIENNSKNLRFLNSGTYIGYAHALASLLSDLVSLVGLDYVESYPAADQTPMGQMLMSGRWNISLDYDGKIFIDCIAFSDEEVKNSEAAVLHFQGQKARGISLASKYFLPLMCSQRRSRSKYQ